MAERTTITQVVQVGVETTPGTGVAATKQLTAMMLDTDSQINFDRFRPSGVKYATIVVPAKDMTAFKLTGYPTYTELVYPFSSLFGAASITTPTGGTSARLWTFNPLATAEDVPKTFTIEVGSALRAHKAAYGLFTGINMPFNRDKVGMGGSAIGQNLQDNITLSGGVATISLQPILPKQIDVFYDATSAALGTTKLSRVLDAEWSFVNKFSPLWVVNSANASFAAHVETEPQARLKLKLEADANGMALLADSRAGTTKFVRLLGTGNSIENPTIAAPSAAAVAGAGLGIGAYKYQITYVTGLGETAGSAEASVTTTTGNQQVNLTAIPTGPTTGPYPTTARKVYRTAVGGATGTEKLVATINDNTTTTYSDTTADGSLGAAIPTSNTSGLLSYYLQIDLACKVFNVGTFADASGVYAIDYELDIVYDSAWGAALKPYLQNTLTAL